MAEIRDDLEAMRASVKVKPSGEQATTFIGRVVNRGAMPTASQRFVVVNPVAITGPEAEGGAGVRTVDATTDVVACWLGSGAPVVGRDVVVYSVANRWVTAPFTPVSICVPCDPCCIPKRNLTVSWTNAQVGGGSALMTWDGALTWRSGCANQLIFTLACVGGVTVFSVTHFPAGGCPSGPPTTDSNLTCLHVAPPRCTPFVLTYEAYDATTGHVYCPYLAAQGYIQFLVTE